MRGCNDHNHHNHNCKKKLQYTDNKNAIDYARKKKKFSNDDE